MSAAAAVLGLSKVVLASPYAVCIRDGSEQSHDDWCKKDDWLMGPEPVRWRGQSGMDGENRRRNILG